jgi:phage head maturation protease
MEQQLDYCQADLELKTVNVSQRLISGYACIHSTADRVNDIIDPNASAKAVARLGSPSDVAVFVGHNTQSLPVGIPQTIQATPQGLHTETYILKGSDGDNVLSVAKDLLDHGQTLGMSIGYKTRDSRHEQAGGKRAGQGTMATCGGPHPAVRGSTPRRHRRTGGRRAS